MQQDASQSGPETFVWQKKGYLTYGVFMFLILSFGFVGNVLTLLVLKQREHRSRGVTPLMVNVALADISIIVFGYPIAIQSTLRGKLLERSTCVWVAFINGTVGITSIFTLTEMVVVSYFGVKQVNSNTHRLSTHQVIFLIGSAWLYGCFCMFPPLLGWSRFVVTPSKISCCPDWAGKSASSISYNLLLVAFGFIFPLTVMIVCYHKIFSLVHNAVVPGNVAIQIRQRHSELRIVRMTAMSVIAFALSWSPYCFVSLAAVLTGNHVIESGEAEIPELLAKASVVYNPIVYTIMNSRFRATLLRILHLRRRGSLLRDLTLPSRIQSLRIDADPHNINKGCERQRHLHLLRVQSIETAVADNR